MKIGVMQFLRLARFSPNGAYLSDESGAEVLLPKRYVSDEMTQGSLVWAFVYTDSDDRVVAITSVPKAFVGDIAALEIVDIGANGAFLSLGIPKDIFMPSKNPAHLRVGQIVVVKITLDRQNRLIARQNLATFLKPLSVKSRLKSVEILPFSRTDIGLNCVVNGRYFGIIHNTDISESAQIGAKIHGIIKKIHSDGKCDLALPRDINHAKERIIAALEGNGGVLRLDFRTPSDEIYRTLKLSKKAFKTAANALVRDGKAKFSKDSSGNITLIATHIKA